MSLVFGIFTRKSQVLWYNRHGITHNKEIQAMLKQYSVVIENDGNGSRRSMFVVGLSSSSTREAVEKSLSGTLDRVISVYPSQRENNGN